MALMERSTHYLPAKRVCGWCKQIRRGVEIHSGAVPLKPFRVEADRVRTLQRKGMLVPVEVSNVNSG